MQQLPALVAPSLQSSVSSCELLSEPVLGAGTDRAHKGSPKTKTVIIKSAVAIGVEESRLDKRAVAQTYTKKQLASSGSGALLGLHSDCLRDLLQARQGSPCWAPRGWSCS